MTKLDYTFKHDTLFKMLFTQYPELLKRLIAELLDIRFESIGQFAITNPEMPPDFIENKFCHLDINMRVNRQRVALEVQVADEKDYPERSLYYWAREYSTALKKGKQYRRLPRAIIISILAFNLFDCKEFYSEFQALEVKRHTPLTDKMRLCYFELRKLPKIIGADDELKLWLNLFKAETEEDLQQIEELGVPIMEQAIKAYRQTKTTEKFMELERMRELTQHNEASALDYARREARREAKKAEREKWQAALAEKDTALAEKDTALAENAVLIAELREQLEKSKKGVGEN